MISVRRTSSLTLSIVSEGEREVDEVVGSAALPLDLVRELALVPLLLLDDRGAVLLQDGVHLTGGRHRSPRWRRCSPAGTSPRSHCCAYRVSSPMPRGTRLPKVLRVLVQAMAGRPEPPAPARGRNRREQAADCSRARQEGHESRDERCLRGCPANSAVPGRSGSVSGAGSAPAPGGSGTVLQRLLRLGDAARDIRWSPLARAQR